MTFRAESAFPGWSDWQLAREACGVRRRARYATDPQAELDQQMRATFTADEVRRAEAYLAAGAPDTNRLTEIESRRADADADTTWLTEQLKTAWSQIDQLRDRIDDGGTLLDRDYIAHGIGYVPWSRETPSG
ncbi:hypothetical protein ACWCQP_44975 [Streptomyces chartreusis]